MGRGRHNGVVSARACVVVGHIFFVCFDWISFGFLVFLKFRRRAKNASKTREEKRKEKETSISKTFFLFVFVLGGKSVRRDLGTFS